jgi:hypothetical protein
MVEIIKAFHSQLIRMCSISPHISLSRVAATIRPHNSGYSCTDNDG